MTDYLQYKFNDSPEFMSTFDELPLWSAPFGLLLLKHIELKPDLTVIDIGSGSGFPLLELAQRLGSSCKCYGIDPWLNANDRARQKIKSHEIKNVEVIINGSAEELPFANESVDLIVSNLGINNFENPAKVFKECSRVLKPGGKLALATNLNGHWRQFYAVFEETLMQLGERKLLKKLKGHEEHRGSVASISKLFTDNGLSISRVYEDQFEMNFLDGTAFLNHYFIKLGWLSSWIELIPQEIRVNVFGRLEDNLNALAEKNGKLELTVPMAFMEGKK